MFVKTVHNTFLGWNSENQIVHAELKYFSIENLVVANNSKNELLNRNGDVIASVAQFDHGFCIELDGRFVCANPSKAEIEFRDSPGWWECFYLIPAAAVESAAIFNLSETSELARFHQKVMTLQSAGQPVCVHCGAGNNPKAGFLNLDITVSSHGFASANADEYFIFPYADLKWPLPDSCVDYICHEDFIEHISQLQQIQFLAETWRVLKKGCYHRVNTPNIIAAMKRHSDFKKGYEGVYTGELEHGHVSLFSPQSLKEIAEMIGYSEVIFMKKSEGNSPYAMEEIRPSNDRDLVTGNVIADLLK